MSDVGKNRYFIVGIRPVQLRVHDQGVACEALDWKTGELVRDNSYRMRVLTGDGEVEEVSEAAFAAAVEEQRAAIRSRQESA